MREYHKKMRLCYCVFVFVLCCVLASAQSQLKPHPRLLVLDSDLPIILKTIQVDPLVAGWYKSVVAQADALLPTPPTQWVSGRMLGQSRQVLSRVSTLAGVYRLTGKQQYAQRAIDEMVTAAKMPAWCPNSFLDPSEMTNALAIGYDWLYDLISDANRTLIANAIYNQGLKYGVEFYAGNFTSDPNLAPTSAYPSGFNWARVFFNWNQVCNGGMLMGALAVWETFPNVAKYILDSSIPSIEISIAAYAPDGGWVESPTYGEYAASYAAYYLGALYSVFGTDFGITSRHPYLAGYGYFHMYTITPGGVFDSWGDSGIVAGAFHPMIFYGHLFNNSQFIAYERSFFGNNSGIDIFHVLYSNPYDRNAVFNTSTSLDAYFKGAQVATARTSWTANNTYSWFAAIKGGNTTMVVNPHQHLDLGNFILEVNGIEVVTDLGADNYSAPGYFNVSTRFSYYLTSSRGHNVFTVNGDSNQNMATSNIEFFQTQPGLFLAIVNTTGAYYPNVSNSGRRLEWDKDYDTLFLTDFIDPNENTKDITWRLHSFANVTYTINATSNVATFEFSSKGTALVNAILPLPKGAKVSTYHYSPPFPEYQTPNLNVAEVFFPVLNMDSIYIEATFAPPRQ